LHRLQPDPTVPNQSQVGGTPPSFSRIARTHLDWVRHDGGQKIGQKDIVPCVTDFADLENVKQAVLDYVRDNDGCSSDDVVAGLRGTQLAHRRAIHEALTDLINAGPLIAAQDHGYVPQAPQDDWDTRWEHLTIVGAT
jgi:hypothetical protein